MSPKRRETHFGVFVLGTPDGATTARGRATTTRRSSKEIARHAERGKFDLVFVEAGGWNVVTSSAGRAALNFSREAHVEHDLRYEVAQEFVEVVKGLRDCWEDGAIVADKATGVSIDPSEARCGRPAGLRHTYRSSRRATAAGGC